MWQLNIQIRLYYLKIEFEESLQLVSGDIPDRQKFNLFFLNQESLNELVELCKTSTLQKTPESMFGIHWYQVRTKDLYKFLLERF